jgi:hypothetical protein
MAPAPKRRVTIKQAQHHTVSVQEKTSSKQRLRRQVNSREVALKKPAALVTKTPQRLRMGKAMLIRVRNTAAARAALRANITPSKLHKAEAASGASFDPAANAIAPSRHKVRVAGFFGKRHWVAPEDIVSFQEDIRIIKGQKETWEQTDIKEYVNIVNDLLVSKYGGCESKLVLGPSDDLPADNLPSVGSRETEPATIPPILRQLPASGGKRKCPEHERSSQRQRPLTDKAAMQPASGGLSSDELERRFQNAFKPMHPVPLSQPIDTAAALYTNNDDAAICYMTARTSDAAGIQWMPQEAANWLYQVVHYAVPLIQNLLGTGNAFDATGQYFDSENRPACGGQIAAFWGTEIAMRRERALLAYDTDVDFQVFITPCCDFSAIWNLVKTALEPLGLVLSGPNEQQYYRISPKEPLTYNSWREWCHEARAGLGSMKRDRVLVDAKILKSKAAPPNQPIGCHFLDLNVVKVVPSEPILIRSTHETFHTLQPDQLFPIVEGFFGPLRMPLPATSAVLDAEYSVQWRHQRAVKHMAKKSGVGKYTQLLEPHLLRSIHPSVPLHGCPSYVGCYSGASCDAKSTDISWRWLSSNA